MRSGYVYPRYATLRSAGSNIGSWTLLTPTKGSYAYFLYTKGQVVDTTYLDDRHHAFPIQHICEQAIQKRQSPHKLSPSKKINIRKMRDARKINLSEKTTQSAIKANPTIQNFTKKKKTGNCEENRSSVECGVFWLYVYFWFLNNFCIQELSLL